MADKIDWNSFETEFAELYSTVGCRAKPIRTMVGRLILKQIYDLSDETAMAEWVSSPYFQYFCGRKVFQWKRACDPSDLVHFRHRIGEAGVEKILAASILIHGEKVLEEDVSRHTTAQPKNITYPTDTRLAVKIIKKCRRTAEVENVELRQGYKARGQGFAAGGELKKGRKKQRREPKREEKSRRLR